MSHPLDQMVKAFEVHLLTTNGYSNQQHRRELFKAIAADTSGADRVPLVSRMERLALAISNAPSTVDVEGLIASGLSEDAVLELILTGAVAAGVARLDIATKERGAK